MLNRKLKWSCGIFENGEKLSWEEFEKAFCHQMGICCHQVVGGVWRENFKPTKLGSFKIKFSTIPPDTSTDAIQFIVWTEQWDPWVYRC